MSNRSNWKKVHRDPKCTMLVNYEIDHHGNPVVSFVPRNKEGSALAHRKKVYYDNPTRSSLMRLTNLFNRGYDGVYVSLLPRPMVWRVFYRRDFSHE